MSDIYNPAVPVSADEPLPPPRPGANNDWVRSNARGYSILEQPCGVKRKVKVIAVGAGAAGIDLAKAVDTRMENVELAIYERQSEVGGCWNSSRYPGCACDIPAVNYQFTWTQHIWSEFYVTQPEILKYFTDVVKDHGLAKYIHLSHSVISAEWQDQEGLWKVQIEKPDGSQTTEYCNVFISATGFLSSWDWPKVPGFENFKGQKVHTADYPSDLEVAGKRVAVLGAGSSAVQVIATIMPEVAKLYTWVRSPVWVTPTYANQYAGPKGSNLKFSEEVKERWAKNPAHYLRYRKMIEDQLNRRFISMLKGTPQQQQNHTVSLALMKQRLNNDARLTELIIPKNFGPGCRRPMPGLGYLEALVDQNTTTYTTGIEKMTEKGFIDPDGKEVEVDLFILATGLNTSFRPRFPIIAHGQDLSEVWKTYPECYLGLAAPGFPNYFVYFGPFGPYAHGSALPVAECYTHHFLAMIEKMQVENIKSFSPSAQATKDFCEHHDLFMRRTIWHAPCSAWYTVPPYKPLQPEDKSPLLYPGSRIHLLENTAKPRFEDYDYERLSDNRFNYWGNGFHIREFDGRDLTWYCGLLDDQDVEPDFEEIMAQYDNSAKHAILAAQQTVL